MDTVRLSLQGAWDLLYNGFFVGAGLPIIFALGVRFLAGPAVADGPAPTPSIANKVLAWVCFAAVAFAVMVGIMIIIGAGLGKVVSFEHIFPVLVPKP